MLRNTNTLDTCFRLQCRCFVLIRQSKARSHMLTLPSAPSDKRVLIVDDNPDLLTIFSIGLESFFKVDTAKDGQEAMDKLFNHCPDVLILDVNMPRKDGFEVLSEVRNNPIFAALKVILITGNSTVPSYPESGEADLVLSKPVSVEELIHLVGRLAG